MRCPERSRATRATRATRERCRDERDKRGPNLLAQLVQVRGVGPATEPP